MVWNNSPDAKVSVAQTHIRLNKAGELSLNAQ